MSDIVGWKVLRAGPIVDSKLRRALLDQVLPVAGPEIHCEVLELTVGVVTFFVLRAEGPEEPMRAFGDVVQDLADELQRTYTKKRA